MFTNWLLSTTTTLQIGVGGWGVGEGTWDRTKISLQ